MRLLHGGSCWTLGSQCKAVWRVFKHQWRDGKHGRQDATPGEVFPSNYVWHVRSGFDSN
ncbi:hypothetical protein LINGRAPRIM_LOCUS1838 [Linum grandiflorum]